MTPDSINALFEFTGALLVLMNVRQLFIDKRLSGVHWYPTAFFSAWGVWNLYYYPALGQWLSFAGGVALVFANTLWVCLAVYYQITHNARDRIAVRGAFRSVATAISGGGAGTEIAAGNRADPDGGASPFLSHRPGFAYTIIGCVVFMFVCASAFAEQMFTENAVIYACKADGKECGWHPARLIFLECREQIFTDHMGIQHLHIYCSQPRYLKPENVG